MEKTVKDFASVNNFIGNKADKIELLELKELYGNFLLTKIKIIITYVFLKIISNN